MTKEMVQMKEFTGVSEKQIKYAKDIKDAMYTVLTEVKKTTNELELSEKMRERNLARIATAEKEINSITDAGKFVNTYKEFLELDSVQRVEHFDKYNITYKILDPVIDKFNICEC